MDLEHPAVVLNPRPSERRSTDLQHDLRRDLMTENEAQGAWSLEQRCLAAFPHLSAIERKRFVIQPLFIELIARGKKETTIRYHAGGVEYPAEPVLPLVATSYNATVPSPNLSRVRVTGVCYKTFSSLDEEDARRDGFGSLFELRNALQRFYGALQPTDVLSIFSIVPETKTRDG